MGITCSGKSEFLKRFDGHPNIAVVSVGKEFRRRYPPERFRGLAAMVDTEVEAWEIFTEQYKAAFENVNTRVILIDGQPRAWFQIDKMFRVIGYFDLVNFMQTELKFLLLHAPEEVIRSRIEKRFALGEPLERQTCTGDGFEDRAAILANRALASDRFINDSVQLYNVITELMFRGLDIEVVYESTMHTAEAQVLAAAKNDTSVAPLFLSQGPVDMDAITKMAINQPHSTIASSDAFGQLASGMGVSPGVYRGEPTPQQEAERKVF